MYQNKKPIIDQNSNPNQGRHLMGKNRPLFDQYEHGRPPINQNRPLMESRKSPFDQPRQQSEDRLGRPEWQQIDQDQRNDQSLLDHKHEMEQPFGNK